MPSTDCWSRVRQRSQGGWSDVGHVVTSRCLVRLVSNSLDIAQSAVGCCAFQEYAELLVGSVLVQGWCRLLSVCMTAYTTTAFTTIRHWAANLRTTSHACCSSACEALEQSCRMEHRRRISSLAGFQAANNLGHPAAGACPIAVRSSQPMLST